MQVTKIFFTACFMQFLGCNHQITKEYMNSYKDTELFHRSVIILARHLWAQLLRFQSLDNPPENSLWDILVSLGPILSSKALLPRAALVPKKIFPVIWYPALKRTSTTRWDVSQFGKSHNFNSLLGQREMSKRPPQIFANSLSFLLLWSNFRTSLALANIRSTLLSTELGSIWGISVLSQIEEMLSATTLDTTLSGVFCFQIPRLVFFLLKYWAWLTTSLSQGKTILTNSLRKPKQHFWSELCLPCMLT